MLRHPDDCTRDQLDVRIVVLIVLGLLVVQVGVLSGGFSFLYALPLAVILYGLYVLFKARLRVGSKRPHRLSRGF